MKTLFFIVIALLIQTNAQAATVKSVDGIKLVMRMPSEELNFMVPGATYDVMQGKELVARVKVKRIFPGKGIVAVIQDQNIEFSEEKVAYKLIEEDGEFGGTSRSVAKSSRVRARSVANN